MSTTQLLPYYLFGIYVLEISKFFETRFNNNIIWDSTAKASTLQVWYGTPRAAFRYMYTKFNNKIVLPMMNFFIAGTKRDLTREKTAVYLWDDESYDPVDNTVAIMRNPAHFDVTFSFNLWTNDNRERDFIMHKIFQSFPMGELSLVYFPDPKVRSNYLLMPLKLSDEFADESNIEGQEMKETRDAVKTTFQLTAHAIVPYNVYRVPVITRFDVSNDMVVYDGTKWQTVSEVDFSENVVGP